MLTATSAGEVHLRTANLHRILVTLQVGAVGDTITLHYLTSQSSTVSRKTFLKDRPDLIAMLDSVSGDTDTQHSESELILIVASHHAPGQSGNPQLRAHLINCWSRDSTTTSLQILETWSLPPATPTLDIQAENSQFELESSSGLLYHLSGRMLSVIELSVQARSVRQISVSQDACLQLLPISKSAVLLSSPGACSIHDTKFGSIQAVQDFGSSSRRKRKRDDGLTEAPSVELISWHPKASTAVVRVGQGLLTIQVTLPSLGTKRVTTRLVDAFGKNHAPTQEAPMLLRDSDYKEKLELLSHTLLGTQFEDLFYYLLAKNVVGDDALRLYNDQSLALRVLALMFDWNQSKLHGQAKSRKQSSISLVHMPVKVFQWLAENNHITPSNISKALYLYRPAPSGQLPQVRASDMIGAFAKQDPSLKHLATLCTTSQLPLEACVESLRYLLGSLDARTISDGNSTSNIEADHEGSDGTEETEASLAQVDLSIAFSLLEPQHLHLRGQALRTIITRLGLCHASSSVVTALRAQLPRQDILLLMNLLRIELTRSGWDTRRLDFYGPTEDTVDLADEAISVITKLLNCSIDAIGMGGWLGSSFALQQATKNQAEGDEDDIEAAIDTNSGTLRSLRVTANNSLETAMESVWFVNFLTDFLRYAGRVDTSMVRDQLPGAGIETNALPLGSKSVEAISGIRIDAGGEIRERSRRDIARKESRRVGRYSFERLRV